MENMCLNPKHQQYKLADEHMSTSSPVICSNHVKNEVRGQFFRATKQSHESVEYG